MPSARRRGSRFGRRGVAALEFGLLAPALLLLLLAGFDVVQSLRAQLRVDSAANQLGQIISRCETITAPGDTALLWWHGQRIIGNLGSVTGGTAGGTIIVTAVFGVAGTGGAAGVNRVAWQQRTGRTDILSSVGTNVRNSVATLDNGFIVPPQQTLIVTEILLPRQPWVFAAGLIGNNAPRTARGTTLFLTRAADAAGVQAVPATSNTPACLG
jgi:hypothetical protein